MNEQSSVVLQDWRRKAAQALSDQGARMIAGTAKGYLLGVKYICKLWQVDDFAQNFIYSSLCYFSFHKQHPSSKVSRHVCLLKAKYSSAVITGSKDYLPNSYPAVYPQNH